MPGVFPEDKNRRDAQWQLKRDHETVHGRTESGREKARSYGQGGHAAHSPEHLSRWIAEGKTYPKAFKICRIDEASLASSANASGLIMARTPAARSGTPWKYKVKAVTVLFAAILNRSLLFEVWRCSEFFTLLLCEVFPCLGLQVRFLRRRQTSCSASRSILIPYTVILFIFQLP